MPYRYRSVIALFFDLKHFLLSFKEIIKNNNNKTGFHPVPRPVPLIWGWAWGDWGWAGGDWGWAGGDWGWAWGDWGGGARPFSAKAGQTDRQTGLAEPLRLLKNHIVSIWKHFVRFIEKLWQEKYNAFEKD